jgi:hypothetical protein
MHGLRSPKLAVVGIGLLLFSIMLAMESSPANFLVLAIGLVGLVLVALA